MFMRKSKKSGKRHLLSAILLFIFLGQSYSEDLSVYPEIKILSREDPLFRQLAEDVAGFYQLLAKGEPVPAPVFFRYKLKDDDDLFTVASRATVYQDTLSTLNRVSSNAEFKALREILIPNVTGLFLPRQPETDIEILMYSARESQIEDALSVSVVSNKNDGFLFFAGEKYNTLERSYFLGILFRLPIRKGYITSEFGYRNHPIEGHLSFHNGIDIAAPFGTEVMAAKEGEILTAAFNEQLGNHVVISHSSGHSTVYGHLSIIDVIENQKVQAGTVIGFVGSTGVSTGPHLHFEIRRDGNAKNPSLLMPIE